MNSPHQLKRKRGALITTWLILMLVSNIVAIIVYFFFGSLVIEAFPNAPSWTPLLYGTLSILNLIFVIFLFKWKLWAFYAFLIVSVTAFIINFFVGLGIFTNLLGLAGVLILFLILKTRWELFD